MPFAEPLRPTVVPAKAERIDAVQRAVPAEPIKVQAASFLDRVAVDPALEVRIVKTLAEIIKTAGQMNFLAGEAIDIRGRQAVARAEQIAERIVTVAGDNVLAG